MLRLVVKSFYASEASDLEIKVNTFYASEASDPRIMRAKRALLERSERFASEASDLEMEKKQPSQNLRKR